MTPDELILKHADQPYNAAKRREYYLRTRELKGRQSGRSIPTDVKKVGSSIPVKSAKQVVKTISPEERRKQIEAKVEKLKNRLAELRKVLKKLVDEAKKRSGVDTKEKDTKEKDSAETKDKPLTAAEKREKAKKEKERRDKEKKETPDQELKALQDKIEDVKSKIKKAIEDARSGNTNSSSRPKLKTG